MASDLDPKITRRPSFIHSQFTIMSCFSDICLHMVAGCVFAGRKDKLPTGSLGCYSSKWLNKFVALLPTVPAAECKLCRKHRIVERQLRKSQTISKLFSRFLLFCLLFGGQKEMFHLQHVQRGHCGSPQVS